MLTIALNPQTSLIWFKTRRSALLEWNSPTFLRSTKTVWNKNTFCRYIRVLLFLSTHFPCHYYWVLCLICRAPRSWQRRAVAGGRWRSQYALRTPAHYHSDNENIRTAASGDTARLEEPARVEGPQVSAALQWDVLAPDGWWRARNAACLARALSSSLNSRPLTRHVRSLFSLPTPPFLSSASALPTAHCRCHYKNSIRS